MITLSTLTAQHIIEEVDNKIDTAVTNINQNTDSEVAAIDVDVPNLFALKQSWITAGSTTFTTPATGYYIIVVQGGGGSGALAGASPAKAGGGYAGEVASRIIYLSAGTAITITIGSGGSSRTGNANNQSNGNNGGTTSFGSYVSAIGGKGGIINTATDAIPERSDMVQSPLSGIIGRYYGTRHSRGNNAYLDGRYANGGEASFSGAGGNGNVKANASNGVGYGSGGGGVVPAYSSGTYYSGAGKSGVCLIGRL